MLRSILATGLTLAVLTATAAASEPVPSVKGEITIVYQKPNETSQQTPTNEPCGEGKIRFGADCVSTTNAPVNPSVTTTVRTTPSAVYPTSTQTALYPREVQRKLKDIGCDPGPVDGVWGGGSDGALGRFYQRAGVHDPGPGNRAPTQAALAAVSSKGEGFCPGATTPTTTVTNDNECDDGFHRQRRGGPCVRIVRETSPEECDDGYRRQRAGGPCVRVVRVTPEECDEGYHRQRAGGPCVRIVRRNPTEDVKTGIRILNCVLTGTCGGSTPSQPRNPEYGERPCSDCAPRQPSRPQWGGDGQED